MLSAIAIFFADYCYAAYVDYASICITPFHTMMSLSPCLLMLLLIFHALFAAMLICHASYRCRHYYAILLHYLIYYAIDFFFFLALILRHATLRRDADTPAMLFT